MKQVQALKVADYNARIAEIARPIVDTLMTRLEHALQEAVENVRPVSSCVASAVVAGVTDPVDLIPVFLRVKTAITNQFSALRGFSVMFSDGPLTPTGQTLIVTLTWP